MPFDFGIGEIAIVLVIGLLVFGPKKLPELGRGLGSGMRDFRRGLSGEADNEPAPPVVVQSTAPVVETAVPAAAAVTEPIAEPVAAAAAEPVASATEAPAADAKPAE
ncbi:MAG: twin-arginine translocase TatA/TatE family subunit [Thermoleophilia bacterium]